jgi:hypothetical protein
VPRPAFIAAVVVVCAVVTFLLENYVIVLVCAVVGASAVVCGLDEFMHTGLDEQVRRPITPRGACRRHPESGVRQGIGRRPASWWPTLVVCIFE